MEMNEMKTLNVQQVEQVSGGFIEINDEELGRAVRKAAKKAWKWVKKKFRW